MKHISLFSGIGGFDLAAQWAGWQNIASCEINPFGRRVLAHYWPDAFHHDDIHTFTKKILDEKLGQGWAGDVVLSGGFPCQPYSAAGKRLGKEDDRHLWPEMLRAIREIAPRYVVGENVRGLVNWSGGLVFDEVQADLEAEGYEVCPFLLPSASVGAPHRRDRIWFVAYRINGHARLPIGKEQKHAEHSGDGSNRSTPHPHNPRTDLALRGDGDGPEGKRGGQQEPESGPACGDAADAERKGLEGKDRRRVGGAVEPAEYTTPNACNKGLQRGAFEGSTGSIGQSHKQLARCVQSAWENFPTQSPICIGDDGLPTKLDGITFSKWRNESIKAYGNAVVPQVVYEIFSVINEIETQSHCLPCGEITCCGQDCPFR